MTRLASKRHIVYLSHCWVTVENKLLEMVQNDIIQFDETTPLIVVKKKGTEILGSILIIFHFNSWLSFQRLCRLLQG